MKHTGTLVVKQECLPKSGAPFQNLSRDSEEEMGAEWGIGQTKARMF